MFNLHFFNLGSTRSTITPIYEIIDFVDAKQALARLEPDMKGGQRFQYPLKELTEVDLNKALKELRGTRMDDNWYYFQKNAK